jgi:hypothetical protein
MKHVICTFAGGFAALAIVVGMCGCEAEPTTQAAITITPSTVKVVMGQSVQFTATGWRDYTWSLSNPALGTLSSIRGDSTIYTSRSTNSATQYIRAQSPLGSSSTNGNASMTYLTGEAEIVHLGSTPAPSSASLTISVDGLSTTSATVSKGGSIVLVASGGTSSYSWSVGNAGLGDVTPKTGATVTYTATTSSGANAVTCTSGGEMASLVVTTL